MTTLLDRVSLENFGNQTIKPKTWTILTAAGGITETTMPEGDTNVDAWVSFTQPLKPAVHLSFVTVRRDRKTQEPGFPGIIGNCTARRKVRVASGDVGEPYHWGLWSDGVTPLAVFVYHDAPGDIVIDGYEAHYKHVPGSIDVTVTVAAPKAIATVSER